MKTVIFNGSPRKNGDTVFLIKKLMENLEGDVTVIDAYFSDIAPCCDCRSCWKNDGCIIDDDMQKVYSDIIHADNIVIASPIYFSELTGPLLNIFSRLQIFYTSDRFLKKTLITKTKKGGLILCGGGNGGPRKAESTARAIFKLLKVRDHRVVHSLTTDETPSKYDARAKRELVSLIKYLNLTTK